MMKLRSRRGVVAELFLVLVLTVFGGAMTATAATPPRGQMIDIGGRSLRMVCAGPDRGVSAKPTVLLEAGAFGFSADWAVVQEQLAEDGVRSCAYDRAGLGWSDPGPSPRDGLAVVSDLEALLKASGEPGPFVIVGHSMAGLRLRLFAARNPALVSGVVLVDAATPEDMDDPHTRQYVSAFVGVSRAVAVIASFGLLQPVKTSPFADKIGLTPAAKAEKQEMFASARHNRVSDEEVETWPITAQQAREAGQYDPAWPVAVITAEHGDGAAWKPQHDAAALASNHGYIEEVKGSEHASLLGLRYADHIVRGIHFVMDAIGLPKGTASPLMDLDAPPAADKVAAAP
jgi:pimeloyl-ACP methyl ester carboxylesterase